jgi:class 3 adenylate cyclase
MNKLYAPYLDQIREVVNLGALSEPLEKGGSPHINGLPEKREYGNAYSRLRYLDTQDSMADVAKMFGVKSPQKPKLAEHPDFSHLRHVENATEEHYIVSMFVDVKNSTSLFRKCTKEQVHLIVNIITKASTHTMSLFGGHIQRLMFDGMFCYFGGKSIDKNKAVNDAIHGAVAFCYFMKYELPEVFDALGLERVHTRIGIDFGEDEQVLWGLNGGENCAELSTTSLHTSLASKMQSFAPANGIMVGANMRERMGVASIFTDNLRDPSGNIDETKRYIFRDPNYTQYCFDWAAYLKSVQKEVINELPDGRLIVDFDRLSRGSSNIESNRLNLLTERTKLLEGENLAFIDSDASITARPTSIRPPKNSFYWSDDK